MSERTQSKRRRHRRARILELHPHLYAVVFVSFRNGRPTAGPTPFVTGFLPDPKATAVNGRPVGVAVAKDGSLLVSDDGGNVVWRVSKTP